MQPFDAGVWPWGCALWTLSEFSPNKVRQSSWGRKQLETNQQINPVICGRQELSVCLLKRTQEGHQRKCDVRQGNAGCLCDLFSSVCTMCKSQPTCVFVWRVFAPAPASYSFIGAALSFGLCSEGIKSLQPFMTLAAASRRHMLEARASHTARKVLRQGPSRVHSKLKGMQTTPRPPLHSPGRYGRLQHVQLIQSVCKGLD